MSLDRKPVASSTVYLGSDRVAGIWNVATTVESRGKGIGTAVTWKPLQEVVKEGYTHAVLRSSQMGYNVYKRLGFEEVFKDRLYIW
jgi:predicted GNAT family acetyltransferase